MRPQHFGLVLFVLLVGGCGSPARSGCSGSACTPPAVAVCGDSLCSGGETCLSCGQDCGPCLACSAAPSCTDAVGVPASPTHRYDLDVDSATPPDLGGTTPPAGAGDCGAAQVRLRVASVSVKDGGGALYCLISATDGLVSEVALTTKTKDLGDGEAHHFDPAVGVFWGQKDLAKTTDNLTITYDCFKVGSDTWSKTLGALGDAAQKAGGIAGPYGWAFGLGAAAAAAAAAAVQAASGDDHRFNVQQTIDKKTLLDLTNGRTWEVRQTGGCGLFCSWDWSLTIESWGCAANAGQTG